MGSKPLRLARWTAWTVRAAVLRSWSSCGWGKEDAWGRVLGGCSLPTLPEGVGQVALWLAHWKAGGRCNSTPAEACASIPAEAYPVF